MKTAVLPEPRGGAPASEELGRELNALRNRRRICVASIEELRAERGQHLVEDSREEFTEYEARIADLELEVERIDALIPSHEKRVRRAERQERRAEVEARIARAAELQARGVAIIAEYGQLARRIDALLSELEQGDQEIVRIAEEAKEFGFDAPQTAEALARPDAPAPLYDPRAARPPEITLGIDPKRPWAHWTGGGVQLPPAAGGGSWIRGTGPRLPTQEEKEARRQKEERNEARREAELDRREAEWLAANPRPERPASVDPRGLAGGVPLSVQEQWEEWETADRRWEHRRRSFVASLRG